MLHNKPPALRGIKQPFDYSHDVMSQAKHSGHGLSLLCSVGDLSWGVALMPRDGWVAQRGRLSGAVVLAIGLVPQFVSMWHILGLECSSWLLYLYVGSLGRDGRTAGD